MTKIYVLTAEHFSTPGRILKTFATLAGAEGEAMSFTNIMLKDSGRAQSAHSRNWRAKVEELQEEHGAQFCYIQIDEQELLCPAPVGPYHGAAIFDQLRLIASLAGTTDKRGHQDQRDAVTYVESVTGKTMAALNTAERELVAVHGEPDGSSLESSSGAAAIRTVRSALALATNGTPLPVDDLARIRAEVKSYNDHLNSDAKPGGSTVPTADDYNALLSIVMDGAPADPVRDAAGDMLVALKMARQFMPSWPPHDPDHYRLKLIDDAIAKAEGR